MNAQAAEAPWPGRIPLVSGLRKLECSSVLEACCPAVVGGFRKPPSSWAYSEEAIGSFTSLTLRLQPSRTVREEAVRRSSVVEPLMAPAFFHVCVVQDTCTTCWTSSGVQKSMHILCIRAIRGCGQPHVSELHVLSQLLQSSHRSGAHRSRARINGGWG